ncbi:uncharacterized protein K452DRAFT_239895 [Aplosporella prunicola CBS 121167]|uniref:Uncharacterized protein n=1 Tax=Aplosporella prunicola CBS 121167 TaxID=1176127 RepID=A0A6A6ASY4_9PEZI|nr:uncharacterized protein K452DRAFT_239895 [Aplosporella prunicola CBS 121167]KAF2135132.1 hypothetical protein K452DRAFT_239895 [Aplosporella prunicola CBS 121167]
MSTHDEKSLFSILCSEKWSWGEWVGPDYIQFSPDGTGEVVLYGQFWPYLALVFTWGASDILSQQITLHPGPEPGAEPRTLARFSFTVKLTRRCAPSWEPWFVDREKHNAPLLIDAAFSPRKLNVSLEEGHFPAPEEALGMETTDARQTYRCGRFALRLCFDESPFPRESDWKEFPGPGSNRQSWLWHTFVNRKLSRRPEDSDFS